MVTGGRVVNHKAGGLEGVGMGGGYGEHITTVALVILCPIIVIGWTRPIVVPIRAENRVLGCATCGAVWGPDKTSLKHAYAGPHSLREYGPDTPSRIAAGLFHCCKKGGSEGFLGGVDFPHAPNLPYGKFGVAKTLDLDFGWRNQAEVNLAALPC